MKKNGDKFLFCLLIAMVLSAGCFLVPACRVSNSNNPAFAGWGISLARILEHGGKLYVDGSHVPLPPLPFVVLHIVTPTGKTWLDESRANYACLVLQLLIMYFVLRRLFTPGIAVLASLIAGTWFFTCITNMLYNTMPQVFVAALCLLAVQPGLHSGRLKWLFALLLGLCSAGCIMAKHSTGVGAVLGVMGALLLANLSPQPGGMRRLAGIAALEAFYLVCTAGFIFLMAKSLSHYIDPRGFWQDVIVHGSDSKGGPGYILFGLMKGLARLGKGMLIVGMGFLMLAALRNAGFFAAAKPVPADPGKVAAPSDPLMMVMIWVTSVFGVLYAVLCLLPDGRMVHLIKGGAYRVSTYFNSTKEAILLGVVMLIFTALYSFISVLRKREDLKAPGRSMIGCVCIAFFACLFHTLSDPTMDNFSGDQAFQPLIILSAGIMVSLSLAALAGIRQYAMNKGLETAATLLVCCWFVTMVLPRYFIFLKMASTCRETAVGIPYLAGAKIPPESQPLVALSNKLKELVPRGQAILLLPGDPNLEAWFDRPRPATQDPVIYTDQYRKAYLEQDFELIRTNMPRAIVIGPRLDMRTAWEWSPWATKLIHKIQTDVIPNNYRLAYTQDFLHNEHPDFFDVYLLNN